MSFNVIASAASSVAHLVSQIGPAPQETPALLGHPLDAVAINPQPLPPHELGVGSLSSRFDAVALNPQPLPPREALLSSVLRSMDAVALNPQPLPPHELGTGSLSSRFDAVALNPQPLPPRESLSLAARIGLVADEFCGTVPRLPPHLPSPPVPR